MSKTFDVIIAGGGPVGLLLACELGLKDVSVLVLERESSDSPLKSDPLGLRGLNTPSVEAFHRRGLWEEVLDTSEEYPTRFQKTAGFQFGGHFAGFPINANHFDLSRWKYIINGPTLISGPTYLEKAEKAFARRAESLGVTILRGMEVTGVSQDGNSVTVRAGDQIFTAKYAVGCDGGRSKVRKEAGFEFVGTEPEFTGYVGICDLDEPDKLNPGFNPTPTGMYIVGNAQIYLVDFDGGAFDRSQTVTREHFQTVLRRVSGTDVTVKELKISSTFTDRAMQVTNYRQGRIFLAGDSAHIHSPLGAQGLNTGLADAMNLGWKLAYAVKGIASADLLDSYSRERHPWGVWALEWTRAQVTVLKPNPFGAATFKVVQDLINTPDGANYFLERIWGIAQRHDLGSTHPLVGASAPDFEFLDGSQLGPKMVNGHGFLIDFTQDPALQKMVEPWSGTVDHMRAKVKDCLGLDALLVRPDGFVAWVAEGTPDRSTLLSALHRWFGTGK